MGTKMHMPNLGLRRLYYIGWIPLLKYTLKTLQNKTANLNKIT